MDKISRERRSQNMAAIRSADMKPELIVRKAVHGMGYRYRLHRKDLPGKPDLVFSSRNKVIFVHGCFWHQHGEKKCKIVRKPKSNTDYWLPKLQRNKTRDKQNLDTLKKMGWDVLIIWECETNADTALRKRLRIFLK